MGGLIGKVDAVWINLQLVSDTHTQLQYASRQYHYYTPPIRRISVQKNEFEELRECLDLGITLDDLKSKKDRTLLVGIDIIDNGLKDQHVVHHVYIESGCLHSLLYVAETEQILRHDSGYGLHPRQMLPKSKRSSVRMTYIPELCDYQFCKIFLPRISSCQFTFNSWRGLNKGGKKSSKSYQAKCAHELALPEDF